MDLWARCGRTPSLGAAFDAHEVRALTTDLGQGGRTVTKALGDGDASSQSSDEAGQRVSAMSRGVQPTVPVLAGLRALCWDVGAGKPSFPLGGLTHEGLVPKTPKPCELGDVPGF